MWSWEHVLPVLKRIESDQDYPDDPLHGREGPLFVKRRFSFDQPISGQVKAFVEGALKTGLPLCPDLNVPNPFGICPSPYNIKDGKRQSTAVAYLEPARGRPNLTIIAEAPVVSLKIAGSRVEAVRYEKDGEIRTVTGDRVVLCSGVYHTPQILMLSGIGPPAELERHGIRVIHGMEGIGKNYQDHAVVHVAFEGVTRERADWVIPGVRLIVKSDPGLEVGNFHVFMRPPVTIGAGRQTMAFSVNLVEQRTRGRLFLKSSDSHELPGIEPQMLEDPADIRAMVSVMEYVVQLAQTQPMREYYGPLLQPGIGEDRSSYARSTYDSYHHGAGTCRMGAAADDLSVVDQRLRVHGMSNLWIGDVSVVPTVPHTNTNLTAIMIGERLAEFLRGSA